MTDRTIMLPHNALSSILSGEKTQTRILLRIPGICGGFYTIRPPEEAVDLTDGDFERGVFHYSSASALSGPYHLPVRSGDRLSVVPKDFPLPSHPDQAITLLVERLDIRPLQSITHNGAIAEGCPRRHADPLAWFQQHWNQNHPGEDENWEANPFVAAVIFHPEFTLSGS